MATIEESRLVYDYIYNLLVEEVLIRDQAAIKASTIKFKEPYLRKNEEYLTTLFNERKRMLILMKKLGIKVFDREIIDEEFFQYKYMVRGYECVQKIWSAAARKVTLEKMNELFQIDEKEPK